MLRIWILLADRIPAKSQQGIGINSTPVKRPAFGFSHMTSFTDSRKSAIAAYMLSAAPFYPLRSEDSAFGAAPIPLSRSVPVRCSGACLGGITKARGGECAKPSAEKMRRVSRFARSGGAAARRPGRRPRPAPSWRTAAGTRRSNRGCRRASRGQPSSAYCRHSKRR